MYIWKSYKDCVIELTRQSFKGSKCCKCKQIIPTHFNKEI